MSLSSSSYLFPPFLNTYLRPYSVPAPCCTGHTGITQTQLRHALPGLTVRWKRQTLARSSREQAEVTNSSECSEDTAPMRAGWRLSSLSWTFHLRKSSFAHVSVSEGRAPPRGSLRHCLSWEVLFWVHSAHPACWEEWMLWWQGRVETCLSFKEGFVQTDEAGLFRPYSDNWPS